MTKYVLYMSTFLVHHHSHIVHVCLLCHSQTLLPKRNQLWYFLFSHLDVIFMVHLNMWKLYTSMYNEKKKEKWKKIYFHLCLVFTSGSSKKILIIFLWKIKIKKIKSAKLIFIKSQISRISAKKRSGLWSSIWHSILPKRQPLLITSKNPSKFISHIYSISFLHLY